MRAAKKNAYKAKITENPAGGRACRIMIPGIALSQGEESLNTQFGDTLYYTMEWNEQLKCWVVVSV